MTTESQGQKLHEVIAHLTDEQVAFLDRHKELHETTRSDILRRFVEKARQTEDWLED